MNVLETRAPHRIRGSIAQTADKAACAALGFATIGDSSAGTLVPTIVGASQALTVVLLAGDGRATGDARVAVVAAWGDVGWTLSID